MIRTTFFGSGEFGIYVLEALLELHQQKVIDLTHVVTQPDKSAGRSLQLSANPVKRYLQGIESDIAVLAPEKLKADAKEILAKISPQLVIVTDYGQFVPSNIIDYPKHNSLNVHPSLLPALRGAVPLQKTILEGLLKTGVTIQLITDKMDAGDILATKAVSLDGDETYSELHMLLGNIAKELVLATVPQWLRGQITPTPQDDSQATYCYIKDVSKEMAQITPGSSVVAIDRMVRALNPNPGVWMDILIKGDIQQLKVLSVSQIDSPEVLASKRHDFGLFRFGKNLYLSLTDGVLKLDQLQLPGKKPGLGSQHLHLVTNS